MDGWKCWSGGTGPCCRYCKTAHLLLLLLLAFDSDAQFKGEDNSGFLSNFSCILPFGLFAALLFQRQTHNSQEFTCHHLLQGCLKCTMGQNVKPLNFKANKVVGTTSIFNEKKKIFLQLFIWTQARLA